MSGDENGRPGAGEALGAYNEPPEVPREEMWTAIRERLETPGSGGGEARTGPPENDRSEGRPGSRASRGRSGRPWRWGLAAAALLVLGVGIGRWSVLPGPPLPGTGGGDEGTTVAAAPGGVPGVAPMRRAAYEHLSATETFLTGVRADARRGRVEPSVSEWARQLLTRTRLMLDAPMADDAELGALLSDLELVLIQVSQAAEAQERGGERAREELRLLTRGMDESDLNLRIEAVLPPPMEMTGT